MTDSQVGAAIFFSLPFVFAVIGALVHVRRQHASGARAVELWLVWWMVVNGAMAIFGGTGHIGPNAPDIAEGIGYTESMFQWEVGWADIAYGALLVGAAWRRDLGWLTAAIVAWAIGYWGDAIGHVMQWVAHDNTEPSNVWSLPADVIGPAVGLALLLAYRRAVKEREPAPVSA